MDANKANYKIHLFAGATSVKSPALCGALDRAIIHTSIEPDFVTCVDCWRLILRQEKEAKDARIGHVS